jgi:hypothetical protein
MAESASNPIPTSDTNGSSSGMDSFKGSKVCRPSHESTAHPRAVLIPREKLSS